MRTSFIRFLQSKTLHFLMVGGIILATSSVLIVYAVLIFYLSCYQHALFHNPVAFFWISLGLIVSLVIITGAITSRVELLSQPIAKFSSIARNLLNNHDLDISATQVLYGRELVTLALSFQNLAEQIQQRDVTTKETQFELENLVAEKVVTLLEINKQLLLTKDDAEAASRSKTVFLTHMSSMLRTPLNGIILYTELISEQLAIDPLDTPQIKKDLIKIKASANHLLTSIDKILELSQVELGQVHLSQDNIIMVDLLEEVESLARSLVRRNNNLFEVSVLSSIPPKFTSDHGKIQQILTSIIDNSSKFTKNGFIKLLVESSEDYIIFTIQDTGCGLSDELQDKLFNGLMIKDLKNQDSLGMSLVLAKRYLDYMGGSIEVQSILNQGTSVVVRIPLSGITLTQEVQNSVLLIGKPALRDSISTSLTKRGLWVTTTTEYSEGAQLAAQLHPHYILYALDKTDVTAWRNLAALRLNPALDKCKILLLHCNARGGGSVGALQEILPKPVSKERLAQVLHFNSVPRKRPYILIIEDDRTTALALARLVEANGWVTEICPSAEEAQPFIGKTNAPALVLLDLRLPGMSGQEFILTIKNQKLYIPVVVVTGLEITGEDLARLNSGLVERATDDGLIQEILSTVQKA